jgi:hypothetical protein
MHFEYCNRATVLVKTLVSGHFICGFKLHNSKFVEKTFPRFFLKIGHCGCAAGLLAIFLQR